MHDSNSHQNSSFISHAKAIALAMGLFTRLPTWQLKEIDNGDMGKALYYFPLVGLIIGFTTVAFGLSLSAVLTLWHGYLPFLQQAMLGVLVFSILMLLTGGLHLDGLADCADAWVGGLGDKQRTLDIMKDPTCGPMAVFAVVVVLLLKAVAVTTLVITNAWGIILLIPVISRTAALALFMFTQYVRPKGMGQAFADYSKKPACKLSLLIGLGLPVLFSGPELWVPLLVSSVLWFWIRHQSIVRIEGITGDVAGSMIELAETSLLVTAALLTAV